MLRSCGGDLGIDIDCSTNNPSTISTVFISLCIIKLDSATIYMVKINKFY